MTQLNLPVAACCLIMAIIGQGDAFAAPGNSGSEASAVPLRGMSMAQVERSFGEPGKVLGSVGDPPITRWLYEGYTVYFDRKHVIHAVTDKGTPPPR